jgi:predicted nucleic acid-binding protein
VVAERGPGAVVFEGHAIQHGLTFITGNQTHYQRIKALGYNLKLDNCAAVNRRR